MPRANSSVPRHKRHKKIIKSAKGYFGTRKSNFRTAKDAVQKSLQYAYRDRKVNKREFRKLWIIRINAAVREHGMNYSQFVYALKVAKIEMDRKTLAYLAMEEPDLFSEIAQKAKINLLT